MSCKNKKKILVNPGCIACGACEHIAPEVFKVGDKSVVKDNFDCDKNMEKVKKAIEACPVGAIELEE